MCQSLPLKGSTLWRSNPLETMTPPLVGQAVGHTEPPS